MPARKSAKRPRSSAPLTSTTSPKPAKASKSTQTSRLRLPPPNSEMAQAVAEVKKEHGDYAILPGRLVPLFNHIETGAFALDFAFLGGFKEGLATMVYGWENSGKTMLVLKTVAAFQRKHPGQYAVFIDAERTLDTSWAEKLGVDLDYFWYSSPITGQEGVDALDRFMHAKECGLIIVDSVPAMVSRAVVEKSADDATMTESARLMGTMCSKITTGWGEERRRGHKVTVLLINQWRENPMQRVGDKRYLPGGKQLNRYVVTNKVGLSARDISAGDSKKDGVKTKASDFADSDDEGGKLKMVMVSEHAFRVGKDKGGLLKAGDFRMVMNDKYKPGVLRKGDYDDAPVVVFFAIKMGLYYKTGNKYELFGFDVTFPKKDAVVPWLYAHPEEYLRLKQTLIALHSRELGMPLVPSDGYLLGYVDEDDLVLPDAVDLEALAEGEDAPEPKVDEDFDSEGANG